MTFEFYLGVAVGAAVIFLGAMEMANHTCYFKNISRYAAMDLQKFSKYEGISFIVMGFGIILAFCSQMIGNWAAIVSMVLLAGGVILHLSFKSKYLPRKDINGRRR